MEPTARYLATHPRVLAFLGRRGPLLQHKLKCQGGEGSCRCLGLRPPSKEPWQAPLCAQSGRVCCIWLPWERNSDFPQLLFYLLDIVIHLRLPLLGGREEGSCQSGELPPAP